MAGYQVGLVLVLSIMVFALYNDFSKFCRRRMTGCFTTTDACPGAPSAQLDGLHGAVGTGFTENTLCG
jgi:hypothetical protein